MTSGPGVTSPFLSSTKSTTLTSACCQLGCWTATTTVSTLCCQACKRNPSRGMGETKSFSHVCSMFFLSSSSSLNRDWHDVLCSLMTDNGKTQLVPLYCWYCGAKHKQKRDPIISQNWVIFFFQTFHQTGTGGSHYNRISVGGNPTLLWGRGKWHDEDTASCEELVPCMSTQLFVVTFVSVSGVFGHDDSEGAHRQTALEAVSVSACTSGSQLTWKREGNNISCPYSINV